MSDTPRTDAADLYDYQTAVEVCGELERDLNKAIEALRELLNDGCCFPNPYTGVAEQFRADVEGIVAWMEEVAAKSQACADSSNRGLDRHADREGIQTGSVRSEETP